MKVVLCGYNWIGCRVLEQLLAIQAEVFVYTHKSPNHVNDMVAFCKKRDIPFSTKKISRDNLTFTPDIIASIYYRYIIADDVINMVNGKIFNLHPSLLPRYRGCSSLTWAMVNGESESGFTYHYIDSGIDTGRILVQKKVRIFDFDTQVTLYHRVMFEASNDFLKVFTMVKEGQIGYEQAIGSSEYYHRGAPFNGEIDPSWDLATKERFIRAMVYPPMLPASMKGKEVWRLEDLTDQH
jgi:methionyl-tRNA formyltransferase